MILEQMSEISTQVKDAAPELAIETAASLRRELVVEGIMEALDVAMKQCYVSACSNKCKSGVR